MQIVLEMQYHFDYFEQQHEVKDTHDTTKIQSKFARYHIHYPLERIQAWKTVQEPIQPTATFYFSAIHIDGVLLK